MSAYIPLACVVGFVTLLAAEALVADAIGSHRLRVDLLVSAIRRGGDK